MGILERELTKEELEPYFPQEADHKNPSLNDLVLALINQQFYSKNGDPMIIENHSSLPKTQLVYIPGFNLPIGIINAKKRIKSTGATTYENNANNNEQFLNKLIPDSHPNRKGVIIRDRDFDHTWGIFLNKYPVAFLDSIIVQHKNSENDISPFEYPPQEIKGCIGDTIRLSRGIWDFDVFYNNRKSGASILDMHLQLSFKNQYPGQRYINDVINGKKSDSMKLENIIHSKSFDIYNLSHYLIPATIITTKDPVAAESVLTQSLEILRDVDEMCISNKNQNLPEYLNNCPFKSGHDLNEDPEARANLVFSYKKEKDLYVIIIFPKVTNRPSCYFCEDENKMILGPSVKEALCLLVVPRYEDYKKLLDKPERIIKIYKETSATPEIMQKFHDKLRNTNL